MSLRSAALSIAAACVLLATASTASAISLVEPLVYGSWRTDSDTFAFGGGLSLGIGSLELVPTVEYVFVDNATDWALNLDAHVPLIPLGVAALYAGGGLGHYWHDPENGEKEKETGVELLGGVKVNLTRFKPFGELKYTYAGNNQLVWTLGCRIGL